MEYESDGRHGHGEPSRLSDESAQGRKDAQRGNLEADKGDETGLATRAESIRDTWRSGGAEDTVGSYEEHQDTASLLHHRQSRQIR